ncbi:MAG: cysteine desulfurase family protein [Thermodesulfobacteriota bacterium]|nr:cysteine desulfurase family protein [Thermodesulfobacteriota bacterium]
MEKLYFDHNATTPVLPRVFKAMCPYLTTQFGNPGCGHEWGLAARRAVDKARLQVAGLLGCDPLNIVFTSGATESNNMVLFGTLPYFSRAHLVTSVIEHPAVLNPSRVLEKRGIGVAYADVDQSGRVDFEAVKDACVPETRLISLMLANNETGVIQPVAEVAAFAGSRGILVHTDAAQAVGKIPVNVKDLGVDYLTVAGHKFYAPKGVGALYIRDGAPLTPLTYGGGQERGLRPGTENVPYIVALGEACALAAEDLEAEGERQWGLGETLLAGLKSLGVDFCVHGDAPRLPNTLSVGFGGLFAGDILSGLVGCDIAASGGAACQSGKTSISHVLESMCVAQEYAEGTIRFSWGRLTVEQDVAELLKRLGMVLSALKGRA